MLACFEKHRIGRCRARANGYLFQFLTILSVFVITSTACSNGNCQVLDSCSATSDCGPGLYCGNCPAMTKNQPVCTRGQAIIPTPIIDGLPFNKYSWLVTHNSFSIVDAPSLTGVQRITFYNQEDTVTNQLNHGVRGLMLDMYDFDNDIWLCHSFRGQCYNFTAFQPAINTLKEVEAFLGTNPSEIVTIIIEDYVHTPKGLAKLFTDAGLDKYFFPVSKMPKGGQDWPTVTDMVHQNYRLLVFTSDSSKEAGEGIAYQWRYMVENERKYGRNEVTIIRFFFHMLCSVAILKWVVSAGDGGVVQGSCPNRKESQPLNSRSASLFLQNYFPTFPVQANACQENSAPLANMVGTCYKAAGNVVPNFLAVNFYMRSDGGGVFDALDRMNGQTLCGCSSVTACQAGAPFGVCKSIPVSTRTPPTYAAGSFSGSVQLSGSASTVHVTSPSVFCLFYFMSMLFLL